MPLASDNKFGTQLHKPMLSRVCQCAVAVHCACVTRLWESVRSRCCGFSAGVSVVSTLRWSFVDGAMRGHAALSAVNQPYTGARGLRALF